MIRSHRRELWFNTAEILAFVNALLDGEFDGQRRKRVLVKINGE